MRKIKLVCLLLAAFAAPLAAHAQNRGRDRGQGRGSDNAPATESRATTVRAIGVSVSKERGATDRQLAPYEGILRSYFPSQSFHFAGEESATVPAGGKASLSVQGQRLDLQSEGGTVFVRNGKGGASLTPGGPGAVFVVGASSAIIVVAR